MSTEIIDKTIIMLQFGKVSCSAVICMLGIAENWKTDDGKYIYERKRYGLRPSVSKRTLCTYMALHMFDLDAKGFCQKASISSLKGLTGFSRKAIKRALAVLNEGNYITGGIVSAYKDDFSFQITEYDKIYMSARQGGTGYFHINPQLIKDFTTYNNINMLRLTLRSYILLDNPNNRTPDFLITFTQLRSWFPKYVTSQQIKDFIDEANDRASVLHVKMECGLYSTTAVNTGLVRNQISEATHNNKRAIAQNIDAMPHFYEKVFHEAEAYNSIHGTYPSWIKTTKDEKKRINRSRICVLREQERQGLALLATKYGLDIVLKALQYLFDRVTLLREIIREPVAYITTLIRKHPNGIFNSQN